MRTSSVCPVLLLLLLLPVVAWGITAAPAAAAQPITIQGVVNAVHSSGSPIGLHLTVLTSGQPLDVYVGVPGLVPVRASDFAAGDAITVTGTVLHQNSQVTLVAWTLQWQGKTVRLRNDHGLPTQSGTRGQL